MRLWEYALDLAHNWEKTNRPIKIHKGTPYYFLGVTAILNNDLENGFLAMHQALKEDYRLTQSETPQKPAYWFVTLDYPHDHFFDKEVKKNIWQDNWTMYYPKGKNDPDYTILKLQPKMLKLYKQLNVYNIKLG